jgi:hypothetical protein
MSLRAAILARLRRLAAHRIRCLVVELSVLADTQSLMQRETLKVLMARAA